jgi:hypothetical protein
MMSQKFAKSYAEFSNKGYYFALLRLICVLRVSDPHNSATNRSSSRQITHWIDAAIVSNTSCGIIKNGRFLTKQNYVVIGRLTIDEDIGSVTNILKIGQWAVMYF